MSTICTVTDLIREYNQSSSGYWFDKSTMRGFSSILRDRIYKDRYFISSEKQPTCPRFYTIRIYTIYKGKINIGRVGDFKQFTSYKQAEKYIENNL